MNATANTQNYAGTRATGSQWFDDFEVYGVNTRFGTVSWFVADHAALDKKGQPAIVAQCESQPEALEKFWPKYVARMNAAE